MQTDAMPYGVIDTLTETVGPIQKVDNIDLYRTMTALQGQVFELDQENRALKAQLATTPELTFRANAYWKGEDGPFCSPCWDDKVKLIRMHHGSEGHTCPVCKTYVRDRRGETELAPIDLPTGPNGWTAR